MARYIKVVPCSAEESCTKASKSYKQADDSRRYCDAQLACIKNDRIIELFFIEKTVFRHRRISMSTRSYIFIKYLSMHIFSHLLKQVRTEISRQPPPRPFFVSFCGEKRLYEPNMIIQFVASFKNNQEPSILYQLLLNMFLVNRRRTKTSLARLPMNEDASEPMSNQEVQPCFRIICFASNHIGPLSQCETPVTTLRQPQTPSKHAANLP